MTSKNLIFLVQSDTTAGFLSLNENKLIQIKKRDKSKNFLKAFSSYKELKRHTRIPKAHKTYVRKSHRTSFVFPNNISGRVIKDKDHLKFIKKFNTIYTTSANISKKAFDIDFAKQSADIIVEDCRGFAKQSSSVIYKLSKKQKIALRK